MMNKLGILIGALVGTVIGGGIGWYLSQKKYTKIANEAIDEAKKEYDTAMEEAGVKPKRVFRKKEAVEKPHEDKLLVETSSIQSEIEKHGYADYSSMSVPSRDEPYIITPEEFGEIEEYDKITLTFYADKIVADENNEIMDETEIQQSIGFESLGHFGEYEDDSVFVRNNRLKTDYEILLDEENYSDSYARNSGRP